MIQRKPDSHKGDNGRVLVVGGSNRFYGAPILAALGAEAMGVDLIYPFMPAGHLEAAKTYSLNFILHGFMEDHLTQKDVKAILHAAKTVDAVVIGPGLGTEKKTLLAVKDLLRLLEKPVVLDADALLFTNLLPPVTVLTPHHGEFRELTGDEPTPENVQKWAKNLGAVILCKGKKDVIADGKDLALNETGNPLMTVGGTGDVLSGVVGALLAQKNPAFEAAQEAAHLVGKAGDAVAHISGSLRAIDVVHMLPSLLHKLA